MVAPVGAAHRLVAAVLLLLLLAALGQVVVTHLTLSWRLRWRRQQRSAPGAGHHHTPHGALHMCGRVGLHATSTTSTPTIFEASTVYHY